MAKKSNAAAAENTDQKQDAAEQPTKAKVELLQQNGVTQPRPGSKTRTVWDIADYVSAQNNRPATLAEVKALASQANAHPTGAVNDATTQTQYNRWRKFHGLPPQGRPPKAKAEEPAMEESSSEA